MKVEPVSTPIPEGFGGRALGGIKLFSGSVQDELSDEAKRRRDERAKEVAGTDIKCEHFLHFRQMVAVEWFNALDPEIRQGWEDSSVHEKEQRHLAKASLTLVDPKL